MDERRLAAQACEGDLAAYEALLRRYQPLAMRAAYAILWNRHDAEEAVQEAFVKAWRNLSSFRPDAPFRPWLLTIVTNEARDRRTQLAERAAAEIDTNRHGPSPEHDIALSEEIASVIAEVNALPELDRTLITYRYFLDLSTPEIAELLNTPPGTVRSRLSRAISTLRSRLNAESAAPDRLSQRSTPHG